MKIGYYPGCSLHKVANQYDKSLFKIAEKMGIELEELNDWNCCGALEVTSVNHAAAQGLVARNLAQAEVQQLEQVIAVCPACSLRHATINHEMQDPAVAEEVNGLLDTPYTPSSVDFKHFLHYLRDDYGIDKIKELVVPDNPLAGKKGVSYYGCLLARPYDILQFEDPDNPTFMDDLIATVGATPLEFPLKTRCCGATQLMVSKGTVEALTGNILVAAKEAGADFIVLACQMCALALDGQQKGAIKKAKGGKFKIPILYFTQLMGIGMGLDYKSLGLGLNYVSPKALLRSEKKKK